MTITYPRDAAPKLHERLLEKRESVLASFVGTEEEIEAFRRYIAYVEPIPSLIDLEVLLDTVFFASLAQEEGQPVSCSLSYCDPSLAVESKWPVVRFASDFPLMVEQIRRISPATDPQAIDIGVFPSQGDLKIWGLIYIRRSEPGRRSFPPGLTFVSRQVGVVAVRDGLEDLLILSHGQVVFADAHGAFDSILSQMFLAKAFHESRSLRNRCASAAKIIDMACVALDNRVGATILVVLQGMEPRALDQPKYGVHESTREVLALALADNNQIPLLRSVARLAFIDGALVVDESGMLLGAGAMIRTEETPNFNVLLLNPLIPSEKYKRIPLSSFSGGARHRSALVFCYLNPGALALVVSHDGVMSFFVRPSDEDGVMAVRPFRMGAPLSL
jgi:DNA integrity scanning protein DisA with diadenylate cyclase activity